MAPKRTTKDKKQQREHSDDISDTIVSVFMSILLAVAIVTAMAPVITEVQDFLGAAKTEVVGFVDDLLQAGSNLDNSLDGKK